MGDELETARRELTAEVMGLAGVTGTAVGEEMGRPCLMVYVGDSVRLSDIPLEVRGFPVVLQKTGTIRPR